ncbi:hypothetical protein ACFL6F_00165 [Planctomycetota bacterium]
MVSPFFRLFITVVISYAVCACPLFPYSSEEIMGMQAGTYEDTGVEKRSRDVLVPGPFDSELSKAGKIWNPPPEIDVTDYEPEKTDQEEPEEEVMEVVAETATGITEVLPPYISAGPDGYGFTGVEVYIGSEKKVPEDILLTWYQTQGPVVSIDNPGVPFTWFVPQSAGVYEFTLDVLLADGSGYSDTVQVLIDEKEGNRVPLAYAGEDFFLEFVPDTGIILEGKGCDADDDPLAFSWMQTGGPSALLFFEETDSLEFIPSAQGIYTFELQVSDGQTGSLPDDISVNCFAPGNNPPVAVLEDIVVPWTGASCRVKLDGSMSYDLDGDSLYFSWSQTDGPPVVLLDSGSDKPEFICTEEGNYWFECRVDDGTAPSIPAEVSVSVSSEFGRDDIPEGGGCMPGQGSDCSMYIVLITCLLLAWKRREWARKYMQ